MFGYLGKQGSDAGLLYVDRNQIEFDPVRTGVGPCVYRVSSDRAVGFWDSSMRVYRHWNHASGIVVASINTGFMVVSDLLD